MLGYWEVFDRFLEGPHVTVMDFDLHLEEKMRRADKKLLFRSG